MFSVTNSVSKYKSFFNDSTFLTILVKTVEILLTCDFVIKISVGFHDSTLNSAVDPFSEVSSVYSW